MLQLLKRGAACHRELTDGAGDQTLVLEIGVHVVLRARHDQHVDRRGIVEVEIGDDAQSRNYADLVARPVLLACKASPYG